MPTLRNFSVFFVDDHPIVRQGLVQLIENEDGLVLMGQADSVESTLKFLEQQQPDVMVVDICLGERDGLELIREIRERFPQIATLVLTMHDEGFLAEYAIRAGARGFLSKRHASEQVVTAIRAICRGEIYVGEKMSPRMLRNLLEDTERVSPIDALSPRESEVFALLGGGMGTREVAEHLSLSIKTIEAYREHIKEKLNIHDACELLRYAIWWSLNKPDSADSPKT